MGKRERVAVVVAVCLGVALVGAGAVNAAVGSLAEGTTEATVSTETTLPADAGDSGDTAVPDGSVDTTETALPAEDGDSSETALPDDGVESETDLSDPDTDPPAEEGTWGQYISGLRHAGDHTPAALLMGKRVPGWDPDKHATTTTEPTVDSGTDDASENVEDVEDVEDVQVEVSSTGSSAAAGHKPGKSAAVGKGKAAPKRAK